MSGIASREEAERRETPLRGLAGLLVAIGFFVATTAVWIRRDTVPPAWDDAQYLQESVVLYRALRREGVAAFLVAFSASMEEKAPLVAVLPLPFYALFGEGHTPARAVNLLLIALASIGLFELGRELSGPAAGLMAVVIVNTFPIVAGMSRYVMTEYGLMTVVIAWMLLLARWERGGSRAVPWLLGLLLGFGLLLKVTLPLYVGVPTAVVLGRRCRDRKATRSVLADLARIAVVALPVAATWYGPNLGSVAAFAIGGGFGERARPFGTGEVLAPESMGRYLVSVVNEVLTPFYCAVALVVATALAARRRAPLRPWLRPGSLSWLLAWGLVPAAVLTFAVNKELRLTVPYLPALALLLAAALAALPSRVPRAVALTVVATAGLGHYLYFSFATVGPQWRWGPLRVVSRELFWAHPPTAERWPNETVVRLVAGDAVVQGLPAPVSAMVLFSHLRLNPLNLTYAASLLEVPVVLRAIPPGSRAPAPELARLVRERADYLLVKTGFLGPPNANERNAEVIAELARGEPAFLRIADFPLPDRSRLFVFRRRTALRG